MIKEQPRNRAEIRFFRRRQLDLARIIELLPANLVWLREFRKHRIENSGLKKSSKMT